MNDTPTPRTDEFAADHDFQPQPHQCLNFASKIERELTAVTEQRDRLAEALNRIANNNVQDLPETDYAYELGRMEGIAKIALQSLTPNEP